MIEKLKVFMQKKYDYDLSEYKVCVSEEKKSKLKLAPLYVFGIVLILYVIQVLGVIDEVYGPVVFGVITILLVMWQVTLIQKSKPQSLVVTPKYLIKCFGKSTFVVIDFDSIKKFKVHEKDGLIISDRKSEISISPVCYQEDLEPIVDILEAKGKTFDKSRDYMKRPVKIRIVNNEIIVQEIKQEESSTEKLVGKYYDKFKMLTPGFIEDIIFMNSVVDEAFENDNNLVLLLDNIEVKEGHPENTGFESIIANDCITIFENIKIKSVSKRNSRDREAVDEILPNEITAISENIGKGVIADWKYRKKGIDLHFAVGVQIVKVSFDYKEVIIGWKNFKK